MGNNLFQRGYSASRQEKERQDKARENMGKKLWTFFLSEDGDEADIRFLTEEPVNFWEHNIKINEKKYEQYTCTGDDCPYCANGDKPTYKGAYLIVDRRPYEFTDKNGKKKKGKDQLRLYIQGMRVVSQLDRKSQKYGLTNRDYTVVRLGKGTSTTYTFENGDESKLTKKEIEAFLPEKLRDDYDGTTDSLMGIVEEQLMMRTPDYDPSDIEDDDDGDSVNDKLINAEDDEEDEPPTTKKLGKLNATKKKHKLFSRAQDSRKPRAKEILKGKMK